MQLGPRGVRAPLALAAAAALSFAYLASCSPSRDAPVFISDAAFRGLRERLDDEVRSAGFRHVELGDQAGEAELLAALGREVGRIAALSPVLAGAVGTGPVAERTALFGLAFEGQVMPPAVIGIRFSRADAARVAAGWLLTEAEPSETVAALFVGRGAEEAAEAFSGVFIAARRENLPIVEWTDSDWSEDSAGRLTASGAAWAYLATPAGQEARWLEALPSGTVALVEAFAPAERAPPAVRAWLTWDIEASLRDAGARAAGSAPDGQVDGRWKVLSSDRKRRF